MAELLFAYYYFAITVLYLVIMAIAFSLIASVASDCQVKCPMLIDGPPDGGQPDYFACLCNVSNEITDAEGYLRDVENQTQFERWKSIKEATLDVGKSCYICESDESPTVYEPCPQYEKCTQPDMLGFRTATNLSICDTQTGRTANADILTSQTVANRGFVLAVLYAIAVIYLVEMLGSAFCFAGFFVFRDKYGSDWSHLSRTESFLGVACKVAPIITRLCNFLVLFFLIVASVSIFEYSVCRYDTNQFGAIVFFPTITGFTAFVGVAWLFTCVFGVAFQRLVPRDTSFYTPEMPTERNDACIKKCCCGFCYVVTTYGP